MRELDVPEAAGYRVSLIDSFNDGDFAAFKSAYGELAPGGLSGFATEPEYFRLKTEGNPGSLGPFILLLSKAGRAEGLAVGRLCRQRVELRIGQFYLRKPLRETLIVPEEGLIARDGSPEASRALIAAVRASFREKRFAVAHFYWLRHDSETYRAAMACPPPFRRVAFPLTSEHWFTDLGASLEEMVAKRSKRHRGNLRRIMRVIDHEKSRFRLRIFRTAEDVAELMADGERVVSVTYQRSWEVGFTHNGSNEAQARRAAETGDLLGLILYADGRPCAFQMGITFRGVHTIMYIAHDPAYDDWSPGIYVLLKSIEALCEDGRACVADYGWGDGEHKRRFGDRHHLESNVTLFAPTLDGAHLCAAMSFLRLITACSHEVAARFGVRDFFKKIEKTRESRGISAEAPD